MRSSAPAATAPSSLEPFRVPMGRERLPQSDRTCEVFKSAFGRLNTAIGSRTIPLRLEIFSLNDVVEAHRRVEQGHVVGKIVLRIA
jgi:hypothetical protein